MWTDENRRNWWQADYFSAKAANSFQVRRMLRMRSRYEVANNPYLFGVTNSNADDLVNTGPTLKCTRSSAAENRQIERAWSDWWEEVEGVQKLKTCKLARTVDGEGFLVLKTVEELEHPVKLYPVDIEADQVTTPAPANLADLWVDGLTLNPVTGKPVSYHVLKHHPGDFYFPDFNPLKVEVIPKRHVIHWFQQFRPGQVRGIPTFTSSLDLFTEMRSFRKSVVANASLAATLTAVIETQTQGNFTDDDAIQPFSKAPIDRGMLTTLPYGYKLNAFNPAQPGTTYEMFTQNCLAEACRPLAYPLNLALGTSQRFNFSSAKLDHINYRNGLTVERKDCGVKVMDQLFRAFIEEARLIPGLLPRSIRSVRDIPHEWHWPGYESIDPVNDANADHQRLANGTLTFREFWARRGQDWEDMMLQQSLERALIDKYELNFGMPASRTITEAQDPAAEPSYA
ncbi:MAG: phage portal protein [Patescibacteria group bacterium]|nr:phage portal protein [Patescibacteria group bacterium]